MNWTINALWVLAAITSGEIAHLLWRVGFRPNWLRNLFDEAEQMERAILGPEQDRAH